MPIAAPKPCVEPGCGTLTYGGRCDKHKKPAYHKHAPTQRITGRKLQHIRAEHFKHNPLCVHCLAKGIIREWTVLDHTKPLAEGGPDSPDNRQGLCKECHDAKSKAEAARGIRRRWGGVGQILRKFDRETGALTSRTQSQKSKGFHNMKSGRNPKPIDLRLIEGNRGRRPIPEVPEAPGKPVKPAHIQGRASEIWDSKLEQAPWLCAAESELLAIYCELAVESEESTKEMTNGRIAQLRQLASDMGFPSTARVRLGNGSKKKDPADSYLT